MAIRLLPIALVLALLGGACTRGPAGPGAPVGGDVDLDDALRAAGAREVARSFVEAYAAAPEDGGAELARLVGTPLLRRWARWLRVQDEGFPGTIEGDPVAIAVGPAVPFEVESVPGASEILRELELRSSVAFAFSPTDADPFGVVRSLDGPMRLIRGPGGDWTVLDFTRDAIPLTSQFEGVTDARAGDARARVAVAVFFAAPTWQFGLVLHASDALRIGPGDVTLVDADGALVSTAGAITTQLANLRAGDTVRGLVAFDARSSAEGLSLRLDLTGPHTRTTLIIPLEGKIHPIEVAGGSPAPAPSPTPGS